MGVEVMGGEIEPRELQVPLAVRFDYSPNPAVKKHQFTFTLKGPLGQEIDLLTVESPALSRVNCKHIAVQILSKALGQVLGEAAEFYGYNITWYHPDHEHHDGGV
jgi:hypothetical protein